MLRIFLVAALAPDLSRLEPDAGHSSASPRRQPEKRALLESATGKAAARLKLASPTVATGLAASDSDPSAQLRVVDEESSSSQAPRHHGLGDTSEHQEKARRCTAEEQRGLPAGWKCAVSHDPGNHPNKAYYYNPTSGQREWDLAKVKAAEAKAAEAGTSSAAASLRAEEEQKLIDDAMAEARQGTLRLVAYFFLVVGVIGGVLAAWFLHTCGYCTCLPSAKKHTLDIQEEELRQKLLTTQYQKKAVREQIWAAQHSEESLREELAAISAAMDKFLGKSLKSTVDKAGAAIVRKNMAQDFIQKRYDNMKEMTLAKVQEAAGDFSQDVKKILELSDEEMAAFKALTSEKQVAPVTLLLAGFIAPAQVFLVVILNRFFMAIACALWLLDCLVLFLDKNEDTVGQAVGNAIEAGAIQLDACAYRTQEDHWLIAHASLMLLIFLARLYIERCLNYIHRRMGQKQSFMSADMDNPRALYLYDELTKTVLYKTVDLGFLADFVLNAIGFKFLMHRTECIQKADYVFWTVRLYNILFVLFFFLNVILIAWAILKVIVGMKSVGASILRHSRQFDQTYTPGLPITSLLLRIVLLRNSQDQWGYEEQVIINQKGDITKEKQLLEKKRKELDKEYQRLETSESYAKAKLGKVTSPLVDRFAEKWEQSLNAMMGTKDGDLLGQAGEAFRVHGAAAFAEMQESEAFASMADVARQYAKKAEETETFKQAQERLHVVQESEAYKAAVHAAEEAKEAAKHTEAYAKAQEAAQAAKADIEESKRFQEAKQQYKETKGQAKEALAEAQQRVAGRQASRQASRRKESPGPGERQASRREASQSPEPRAEE